MVNSQSQRPAEKSGDLIFRLRDTSRTEFLSKSTQRLVGDPLISKPQSSRLCHRPHSCGSRALYGSTLANRLETKDLPRGTRRSQTPRSKCGPNLSTQTIRRVTGRDSDTRRAN